MKEQNNKKTYKKVLPNGVTLYMHSNKYVKRVYASYIVRYGVSGSFNNIIFNGKHEYLPFGLAHFIEHTLIEHSKYGNMLYYFKDKNYEFNGATSNRQAKYYLLGYKDIKESIKKLINMVDDPVFTKDDIEKVKPAVIEELTQYGDSKYMKAFSSVTRNLYSEYEERHESLNRLGTKEETEAFTYELVKKAYDAYYFDANKILIIGGNIDIEEMEKHIESIYKELKPHKKCAEIVKYNDFKIRKKREVLYENINNDFMIMVFKRKLCDKKDFLKEKIYRSIYYRISLLDNEDYINKLNDEKIIVGPIDHDDDVTLNAIEIGFYADVLDEKRFEKELIKHIKTNIDNITEEDFNIYKKIYVANSVIEWDDPFYIYNMYDQVCDYYDQMNMQDLTFSLDYKEFKAHIKSIDYSVYTKVIMKNKK